MVVSIITSSLLVYILWIVLKQNHAYTYDNVSCSLTEACHVLYNMQLDDKCKIELKDSCWDTDHLFLGQENLCLGISHKIVNTHFQCGNT